MVSSTCNGCAEIYYTFQTTTSSGTADTSITVVQGKNTIFSNSYSFPGIPAQSNQIITTGLIFASNAKKGRATIKVSTTIGATKISGSAAIYLTDFAWFSVPLETRSLPFDLLDPSF